MTGKLEIIRGATHRILSDKKTVLYEWEIWDETEHYVATVYGDEGFAHNIIQLPSLLATNKALREALEKTTDALEASVKDVASASRISPVHPFTKARYETYLGLVTKSRAALKAAKAEETQGEEDFALGLTKKQFRDIVL